MTYQTTKKSEMISMTDKKDKLNNTSKFYKDKFFIFRPWECIDLKKGLKLAYEILLKNYLNEVTIFDLYFSSFYNFFHKINSN